jgi:hypothetical protein
MSWSSEIIHTAEKEQHLMQRSLEKQSQAVLADWYKYSGETHPFLFRVADDVFT